MSKLGTKNALFGYFWLEFEKNIVIFEISSIEFISLIAKFRGKIKFPKFGIKNALFEYF